ncbi:MAG: molybdenum cofactor guanylyltransferase [Bacteroidetes bacterium]|nr:molybdenum cofactor guanylyltransferase [Bacteroidota bacterium]MBS1941634.1 molybdenum cofactor guanylyltransferase [Bacteroidota bacterium]
MGSKYAWTGVVLAGGKSTRMGQDKALLEVDGKPLLLHAIERLKPHVRELLVVGDPHKYGRLWPEVLPDEIPGMGPLGGIITAMGVARFDRLLVLAVDVPGVNDRLLERLTREMPEEADALVPRHNGDLEPLVAAWHRRCLPALMGRLMKSQLAMHRALEDVRTAYLDINPGEDGWPEDLFRNLNSPADL